MTQHNNQAAAASKVNLTDKLLTWPQYLLPQHLLSLLMYKLTRCQVKWFKNIFIRFIIRKYQVNVAEAAVTDLDFYPSFNAFFTRELRSDARPVAQGDNVIVSPVDGAISQLGPVLQGRIIQAKGRDYSVSELLGGNAALAAEFDGGQFATLYLSPRDYHRIHMPSSGRLRQMIYVPGDLFSVSPRTARAVPNLFARNERVITVFDTEYGPLVLVLVGAIFVGSMETVWAGQITPDYGKNIVTIDYADLQQITLAKAAEMGRFNMGSTVVMLLPSKADTFLSDWQAGMPIKLGQAMT